MKRSVVKNVKTLETAFQNAATRKDQVVLESISKTLAEGMNYALGLHEEDGSHNKHILLGDTYGWMVVKDGVVLNYAVNTTGAKAGKATDLLLSYAHAVSQSGWVGVLMAQMSGENVGYMSYRFEIGVLDETTYFVHDEFMGKIKRVFK